MPPELVAVFLDRRQVPDPDAFLGEDVEESLVARAESVERLLADEDSKLLLEAAAGLPDYSKA